MTRLTPRVSGIRRLGAGAIDMAYVACGRFDAYWEQSVSAWDIAAGVILVEETGGVVTDTLGRKLEVHNGTVLATTPALQAELLAAIAPVSAATGSRRAARQSPRAPTRLTHRWTGRAAGRARVEKDGWTSVGAGVLK